MFIWAELVSGELKFPLKFDKTYQISRPAKAPMTVPEDTAIVRIENDKSISRKHAKMMITSSGLFKLEDESKYSSKLKRAQNADWEKVVGQVELELDFANVHIELQFGLFQAHFTIKGTPMTIDNGLNLYVSKKNTLNYYKLKTLNIY